MYGFYSQEAAHLFGSNIYATPGGGSVEVTCVTSDFTGHTYHWEDKVFVGEVSHWIGIGRPRHAERAKNIKKFQYDEDEEGDEYYSKQHSSEDSEYWREYWREYYFKKQQEDWHESEAYWRDYWEQHWNDYWDYWENHDYANLGLFSNILENDNTPKFWDGKLLV